MNQEFILEYENLKQYLTDGQKATIDDWMRQLQQWQSEEKQETVEATQEGQLK